MQNRLDVSLIHMRSAQGTSMEESINIALIMYGHQVIISASKCQVVDFAT